MSAQGIAAELDAIVNAENFMVAKNNMAFFNGQIAQIDESILRDIDVLLEYVERWNKKDEELQVADAAARVETYLRDYRKAEKDV